MTTNDKTTNAKLCSEDARSGISAHVPSSVDTTRRDAIQRCLAGRLGALSIDELRVLDVITTRMIGLGRDMYGPLDLSRERRDWRGEQASEYADAIFYGACHEVASNDERLERLRCDAADEIAGRVEPGLRELRDWTDAADAGLLDHLDERFDHGGEG